MISEPINLAPPSTETMLSVLIGASDYPRKPDWSNPVLGASAQALRDYVLSPAGLALAPTQLLDLFDDDTGPDGQLHRIADFLTAARGARDLLVYYIGHGGFHGDEYYLGIRNTKRDREFFTTIESKKLAKLIRDEFRRRRVYVVLDSCFSAAAASDWQGNEIVVAVRKMSQQLPAYGTVLLAAASKYDVTRAPRTERCTVFTGAMLSALTRGVDRAQPKLSIYDLYEEVRDVMRHREIDYEGMPEIYVPNQRDGDVSRLPLFPNAAYSHIEAYHAAVMDVESAEAAAARARGEATARAHAADMARTQLKATELETTKALDEAVQEHGAESLTVPHNPVLALAGTGSPSAVLSIDTEEAFTQSLGSDNHGELANGLPAPASLASAKTSVDLHARDRTANPPHLAGVEPRVDTAGTTVRPHRRSIGVIAAMALAGAVVAVYFATRDHARERVDSGQAPVATALSTTSPKSQPPVESDVLKRGSPDSSIESFDAGMYGPADVSIDASISCTGEQVLTSGHCCWSRQKFDDKKQACDGKPECPKGLLATDVDCVVAWIGDWDGRHYQDGADYIPGYEAFFSIHLKEIDDQSGQCGSFEQVAINDPGGPSCHGNLYSCKRLPSIRTENGGLIAYVTLSNCNAYIKDKLVSLKIVVNNINQIKIVFRDEGGDSTDEFLTQRSKDVRPAPPSQSNKGLPSVTGSSTK